MKDASELIGRDFECHDFFVCLFGKVERASLGETPTQREDSGVAIQPL